MASGLYFNYWGHTHTLELELFEGSSVWRAIVDGSTVVFFEAEDDLGASELMGRAIDVWLAEGLNLG